MVGAQLSAGMACVWTGAAGTDPSGPARLEGESWLGWSLAAGYLDGDGMTDLAVGAPGATPPSSQTYLRHHVLAIVAANRAP